MYWETCFISECKERALFSCSCSKEAFFCNNHIGPHLLSLGNHIQTNLVTIVPENLKQKVIDYLTSSKKQIRKNIQKIHELTNNVIDIISIQDKKACQRLISEQTKVAMNFINFLKNIYIDKEYIENIISDKKHNAQELELKSHKIIKEIENIYRFDLLNENIKVLKLCSNFQ